jgi:hypothetical protein
MVLATLNIELFGAAYRQIVNACAAKRARHESFRGQQWLSPE